MKRRIRLAGLVAVVGLLLGGDLLACGDKFLMASRGTRYQRPKNFRAASVVIYADPASGLRQKRVESILKHEGHRYTSVQSFEQLSAVLAGGRFDVVLASSSASAPIEKLLADAPDRAILVSFDAQPKGGTLLKAVDKAVEQRDQNLRKMQTRSS
jgi:hypothetical protein